MPAHWEEGNCVPLGCSGFFFPLFGKIGAYVLFAPKPQVSEPNSTHA